MVKHNVRMPSPPALEPYDPKNRVVGGIVLFLLMLSLYVTLKALLGVSSTGADYALREPLPDEITAAQLASNDTAGTTQAKPKYPIINKFVFLDLQGQPMQDGSGTIELEGMAEGEDSLDLEADAAFDGVDGKEWYVQAASFKDKKRAQTMQKKLKNNGYESRIVQIGEWYGLRLLPQDTKGQAKQQLRALRRMGIKGQIRHIK